MKPTTPSHLTFHTSRFTPHVLRFAYPRLFDLVVAAIGLALLSPLLVAVALAVKLQDGGPVFYVARRVGRGGRLFRLYKFRTMVVSADKLGPAITGNNDIRITLLGRRLRRTKVDELPQLFNVLIGDMSLVGPRPEDPAYVALYSPVQRRVLSVRPGITSAASLAHRHEEYMLNGADWETIYRNEIMPAKLNLELEYLANRSLWSDLGILTRTVAVLFGSVRT